MKIEKYKLQYEYECICGYAWIDSENNGCPMCGESAKIIGEPYQSLPPESFDRKH